MIDCTVLISAYRKSGLGDCGVEGIRRFIHQHQCNDLCERLGVQRKFYRESELPTEDDDEEAL